MSQGVTLRHYLVSSGLTEIIEGTRIYKRFHNVFASEYWFEAYDLPYPKRVITDTGKTQYLFRINKGIEDLGASINQHMPEDAAPDPVLQHDLLRRRRHRRAVDGGDAHRTAATPSPSTRPARPRANASTCSRPAAAISSRPPTIAAAPTCSAAPACCSIAFSPTSAFARRCGASAARSSAAADAHVARQRLSMAEISR